jgi:hypothetical protein
MKFSLHSVERIVSNFTKESFPSLFLLTVFLDYKDMYSAR